MTRRQLLLSTGIVLLRLVPIRPFSSSSIAPSPHQSFHPTDGNFIFSQDSFIMSRSSNAKSDINPYIPKYISSAPWYTGDGENKDQTDDYLKHQRSNKEEIKTEWYRRGKKKPSSTKYRKGACQNCGSMGHQAKDCMERPRKVGAKYSGMDIRADDDVQDINTTWESKRDRWNGFDADDYKGIMNELEKRQEKTVEETPLDEDSAPVKSLRERNDKARYLDDLSGDSVFFNPKSRTLRPEGAGTLNENGHYSRTLRDKALEYENKKLKAEEQSIQMESGPTGAMVKLKALELQKTEKQEAQRKLLLSKYGGEKYLVERPKELDATAIISSDDLKDEKPRLSAADAISRYPEDIYPGNHSSVWGSYWKDGKWGYACCLSLVKASYCVTQNKGNNETNKRKHQTDENGDDYACSKIPKSLSG